MEINKINNLVKNKTHLDENLVKILQVNGYYIEELAELPDDIVRSSLKKTIAPNEVWCNAFSEMFSDLAEKEIENYSFNKDIEASTPWTSDEPSVYVYDIDPYFSALRYFRKVKKDMIEIFRSNSE